MLARLKIQEIATNASLTNGLGLLSNPVCYLALYLISRSQVQRYGEQCVLLLTSPRLSSLRLIYTPSDFILRPGNGSRTWRSMGHGIRCPEGISKYFRSAFTWIVAFCYFVVCKLRTIHLFSSHLPHSSFPHFTGNLNSRLSFHPFCPFFLLRGLTIQYLRSWWRCWALTTLRFPRNCLRVARTLFESSPRTCMVAKRNLGPPL